MIEKVAVKPENIWVTREKLHTMSQDAGEPITSYATRLKGQARLCNFKQSIKCGATNCSHENEVDFTEVVLMGEVVRGLADADIKTVVLGEVEQKANLDDLVRLIQAKEYAKSSTSGSSLSAISTKENVVKLCTNCNTEHERGSQWRKFCPAQKKTCRK